MTRLNLLKAANKFDPNKSLNWNISVRTETREELIELCIYLAKAFRKDLFRTTRNPPIIVIHGDVARGKSMITEAMMKTFLDQCDPYEMIKIMASQKLFIEDKPMQACDEYCYALGTTDGLPMLYSFDRISEKYKSTLVSTFNKAALQEEPKPVGGAIFVSGRWDDPDHNPWMTLCLTQQPFSRTKKWKREVDITIHADQLHNCQKFKTRWQHLQKAAESGNFRNLYTSGTQPQSIFPAFGLPFMNWR